MTHLTAGQRQALRELESIAAARPQALELLATLEPAKAGGALSVDISLDCTGFEHVDGGLQLREREPLRLVVPAAFPFSKPDVVALHRRWAGAAHVQWGEQPCLYQAISEWIAADGMFGFMERLELWLREAAKNELDPAGAPLHPPVAYVTSGTPMVIARHDTPDVTDEPWLGWVALEHHGTDRIDLGAWTPATGPDGSWTAPPSGAATVVLLPTAMDWEYPRTAAGLLFALIDRGVRAGELMAHLRLGTLAVEPGEPLYVIVGAAMRGTQGQRRLQHLTCWRIPADATDDLRKSIRAYSDEEARRLSGEQANERLVQWLTNAKAEWCRVQDARPEITVRRDDGSPMQAFAGKHVAVWGAGALGAPVAEWLARAGVRRLDVIDYDMVTPGVLVRQPFTDDDVGAAKVDVVADRLRLIRPDLDVRPRIRNLLRLLDEPSWNDGADVVMDCSASLSVQTKLERVLRDRSTPHPAVACLMVGHTAQLGVMVLAQPGHGAGSADVLRSVKLECLRRRDLRGFAQEFWPLRPRGEHFQPEPGCSDATFRGSGAEAGALAATMLVEVARGLATRRASVTAEALLTALPGADHPGTRAARLTFAAPLRSRAENGDDRDDRDDEAMAVLASPQALRQLRTVVRAGRRERGAHAETGGLIFGQRDTAAGVVWISELTGPPPDSVQTAAEFVCGVDGVAQRCEENRRLGRGSLELLGMWHTHPDQGSAPSARDLLAMGELGAAAPDRLARGLILIVGHARALDPGSDDPPRADLGAYLYDGSVGGRGLEVHVRGAGTATLPDPESTPVRDVGLALSGGGSRAIAFHLGCLRALHDRGALDRVQVVSGVSGGALLAACYVYGDESFDDFDARVRDLLKGGLQAGILRRALRPHRVLGGMASRLVGGGAAAGTRLGALLGSRVGFDIDATPPLRRWVTRTDAFADLLAAELFGQRRMADVSRNDLAVVLNACDLRTGSAFRFGSRESGTYRNGRLLEDPRVADAVAASAAYPLALPALDRRMEFAPLDGSAHRKERVVLTDGGVFDNLGTSCLLPGRSVKHSTNVFAVDYIVACDAGRGLLEPSVPFGATSRLSRSFTATFRKAQDAARSQLHQLVEHGQLTGFALPYLGQDDRRLPHQPPDLIARDQVAGYPTDFASMNASAIELLTRRGEQLTHITLDQWCPQL